MGNNNGNNNQKSNQQKQQPTPPSKTEPAAPAVEIDNAAPTAPVKAEDAAESSSPAPGESAPSEIKDESATDAPAPSESEEPFPPTPHLHEIEEEATDIDDAATAATSSAGSTVSTTIGLNAKLKPSEDHVIDVIMERLKEYAAAMAPAKPITPADGGRQQQNLFRTLEMILRLEGQAFTKAWSLLLTFVAEHRKGVFGEKYAMRFLEQSRLDGADQRKFMNIMNLIINTALPDSRRHQLQHISIESTVVGFNIDNLGDKLIGYYHH